MTSAKMTKDDYIEKLKRQNLKSKKGDKSIKTFPKCGLTLDGYIEKKEQKPNVSLKENPTKPHPLNFLPSNIKTYSCDIGDDSETG